LEALIHRGKKLSLQKPILRHVVLPPRAHDANCPRTAAAVAASSPPAWSRHFLPCQIVFLKIIIPPHRLRVSGPREHPFVQCIRAALLCRQEAAASLRAVRDGAEASVRLRP
ncbi:hypothetical protein TcCL_Unassigned01557, partial [Trypanosoma cruzi]